MAKAQRSIVIDVPADKLYDVISDFGKYAEFLPEVKKTEVKTEGAALLVTYTIDIKATKISYTLRHTGTKPGKLQWTLVKGDMMKTNDGTWTLRTLPDGRTEATYDIELKLGALVPSFMEKALAEQGLPALLDNFRKRAEGLHPKAKA
jgi:ribosome-associated toxin RatA of RatAB toxin-antitoxin module